MVFSGLVTDWRFATCPTKPVAILSECRNRRRGATTLLVGDNDGVATFHDGDHRIRGAKVDADDFAHNSC